MQVPTGFVLQNGQFLPDDWAKMSFAWSGAPLTSPVRFAWRLRARGYLLRRIIAPRRM
jgi:hypothetical protein